MIRTAKTVTTAQIEERIRQDFARKYRRFASFVDSGDLWDSLMEVVRDPKLLGHYQFCNDVMGIPPVRVHVKVCRGRIGQLDREHKQAMGAFWGFVFKEALGYTGQQSVSCAVGGLKTATRYTQLGPAPIIEG